VYLVALPIEQSPDDETHIRFVVHHEDPRHRFYSV
jgi:hypothetical protein